MQLEVVGLTTDTLQKKQVRKELQSNSHEALFSGSTVTIYLKK